MANTGDYYDITLKEPHIDWGNYRNTNSRDMIEGECYIPIPADEAYRLKIYNQNGAGGSDVLGKNLFNWKSADGKFKGKLKAQGNQNDKNFAKQLSGDDNLKALNPWFRYINAQPGDTIRVTWESPTDIIIEKI